MTTINDSFQVCRTVTEQDCQTSYAQDCSETEEEVCEPIVEQRCQQVGSRTECLQRCQMRFFAGVVVVGVGTAIIQLFGS